VNVLDMLSFEAGAFYVMDRGYVDFARLYALHQAGAFFVTRAKAPMGRAARLLGTDRPQHRRDQRSAGHAQRPPLGQEDHEPWLCSAAARDQRPASPACLGRFGAAVRWSVFLIGPDKNIKMTMTYPMTSGRNFDEILRVLYSVQLTTRHKVATPVNWKRGEDVILAGSVSDDEAKKLFPGGWKAPKPYLRVVKQPG
jgi:C-terminal domain of 1-Cys peroxiredoxin